MIVRECDFCAIGAGRAPATVVWEDGQNMAFFPLRPAVMGHTLVIPKVHYVDLFEVPDSALPSLMQAVTTVGRGLRAALNPDGMNVINSAGRAASQSVFHVHVHLVPRWAEDRFGNIWPPSEPWTGEVKEGVAEMVRQQLTP
ncbi:HIT domain-containing protein [Streptomyces sp. NPDC046984]|uniref:HIT family protein n=1 Tax=Streptomyces sp. NPDC046984 TaxID=3155138 RepID=UPI0033C7B846